MTFTTQPNRSFAGALSVQMRVIVALVLRELVMELGQSRAAIFWMFFRPAILVAMMYAIYSLNHSLTPQGMPLMAFCATGWAAYFSFMRTMADTTGSVKGGSGLLMFPQMTALDLFISQTVTQWFIYNFVFIGLVGFSMLVERSPLPANPLQVMLAYWACGLVGACLALIIKSFARIVPALENIVMPIRRLGHFVSGVIVSGADTPSFLLPYFSWNPLFHAIELMREAWWPAYVSPIADAWYVFRCLFFMAAIGLILERATRRFLEP